MIFIWVEIYGLCIISWAKFIAAFAKIAVKI